MIPEAICRACFLSAEGRGAISILRVWGPDALAIVDRAFRTSRPPKLSESPRNRPRLGRIGAGMGDEAVAVVFDGPVPEVEIQGHGGRAARLLAMEGLGDAGAVETSPREWANWSGIDLIKAEALLDLAETPTIRTAEIVLDQSAGALRGELVDLAAEIDRGSPESIPRLDALLAASKIGLRLIVGWKVVIAGRPNVGKSRLLNAIAGFDRAIVSPTPGTTRDVVSIRSAIDGWPVELSDTAGIRPASDEIEAEGIARGSLERARASVVLLVFDRSAPLSGEDLGLLDVEPLAIRIANKCDLAAAWPAADLGAIEVSATTGEGISRLLEVISARMVADPPPAKAAVPFRERQVELLGKARKSLDDGLIGEAARAIRQLVDGAWSEESGEGLTSLGP